MKQKELNEINVDIIFFFLLVIASLTSFFIINEKKKMILKSNSLSQEELNRLFRFNRRLIFLVDIYFVINAYLGLKEENDLKKREEQKILFIASSLNLIAAFFYLFIRNTQVIQNT